MARNTNFRGVNTLKDCFNKIKDEFKVLIMLDVAPNYYVQIESEDESLNLEKINELEKILENELIKNNCLYKKIDIVTTNNFDFF